MATPRPAGPYPIIDDSPVTSWLVRFDDKGNCASPATQAALLGSLSKTTDVIFFSHGWKTDFRDALGQYGEFLKSLKEVAQAHGALANVVFVGITWPSKWFPGDKGPKMAAAPTQDIDSDEVRESLAVALPESDRARFYELTDAAALDPAEAAELAKILLALSPPDPGEEDTGKALATDEVLKIWRDIASASGAGPTGKPGFATGAGAGGGPATAGNINFDPADILRMFSLYQMKDRAAKVGRNGVAKLLSGLTEKAGKVIVLGHSFGAKVMLSAVKADPGRKTQPSALLLLQPALSQLCFAPQLPGSNKPGGYAGVPALVASPVLTTFSNLDEPLYKFFHLGVRRPGDLGEVGIAGAGPSKFAALGGYGPHGADASEDIPMPGYGQPFTLPAGKKIVGLNGGPDKYITSHVDVFNKHVAWLAYRLLRP